jgi:hypothetical protein
LKNKGTIIAVAAVALVLLVSAGIAVAAGVAGDGAGNCRTEDGVTRVAGDAYSFGCRNSGEESNIRAENRVGEENGACEGDCDQDRLRERDCDGECDGTCDGDGAQNRNGNQTVEEIAAEGQQANAGAQNGECAGDCDRIQDRLCDGSCDGDGTQSRTGGGK